MPSNDLILLRTLNPGCGHRVDVIIINTGMNHPAFNCAQLPAPAVWFRAHSVPSTHSCQAIWETCFSNAIIGDNVTFHTCGVSYTVVVPPNLVLGSKAEQYLATMNCFRLLDIFPPVESVFRISHAFQTVATIVN